MAGENEGANGGENGDTGEEEPTHARRILTDIAPRSWEHPADRAALQALRKIPVFDEVLKRLFGFFGEKPIRLAFLSSAWDPRQREEGFGRLCGRCGWTILDRCPPYGQPA